MVAVGVDPGVDLGGVEAEEVAPLDEGDAAFGDEASDVADVDAEVAGELGDGEQVGELGGLGGGHGGVLSGGVRVPVVVPHPP